MKKSILALAVVAAMSAVGCARVETGEVGVRVGFDKQVKPGELLPGSFNQTIIGDILTFPVKDVNVVMENLMPQAADNSTMKDVDAVIVYNINPQQASELYATKNKSFHAAQGGDIYLMYNYVVQLARNAIVKSARKHDALDMADKRETMENDIKELIVANLREEKLDGAITISQVMVRSVVPADAVVASANELVRAKNELKQKEVEVKTAEAEARRIAALNANKGAIDYMNAQSLQAIAEGVKTGKVHSVVVPYDFKGIVNVGK